MNAIRDRIKKFARIPSRELKKNPRNWRTHPKKQREALAAVLAEIGFADCVLVREVDSGYELIDGHLRLDLMENQKVPALVLDVTEDEADKILLTLDPLAGMAGTDKDALSALASGFETSSDSLRALIDSLKKEAGIKDDGSEANDPEPQIDKAEELCAKWGVDRGQIWELGRHRILCGDSTSEADVARLLGDDVPLLMVTDPPYGIEYDASWRAKAGINKNQDKLGKVENDHIADWSPLADHLGQGPDGTLARRLSLAARALLVCCPRRTQRPSKHRSVAIDALGNLANDAVGDSVTRRFWSRPQHAEAARVHGSSDSQSHL